MAGKTKARKTAAHIKAIIGHEIRVAENYDSSELTERRARNIQYSLGRMGDLRPTPNRSRIVSKDVKDVIGWMLPGIVRTFTASGEIVEFTPETQKDEQFAKQASTYIHNEFWKENAGYRILYNATHDSLLQADAIVKQWWDDTPIKSTSVMHGLTELQLAAIVQDDTIEILTQDERKDDETGETVFDIKIEREKYSGRLRYDVIRPERYLQDKDQGDDDTEWRFKAHWDEKSRSQLIEMGFDRKQVEALPMDGADITTEEAIERQEDRLLDLNDTIEESTQLIELYECYLKVDVDDDGVSETVRAWYAGKHGNGELLDWEVWDDEDPFTKIPCLPVPHRWDSESIADDTADIQRAKSVIMRQMLDNFYAVNNPQREVEEGSVLNRDALVNPKFGEPIYKKKGSATIQPHVVPFVADKSLLALDAMDKVIEKRTGISRQTMALDPDALQNQTATAVQKATDSAYSKIEMIARNMAELGWKQVFRKSLRLIVKNQDFVKQMRLSNGEWETVDPRPWNANMDVEVNIGLGTGSRDRDMAMLNNVLNDQQMLATAFASNGFMPGAIMMLDKIRDTMVKKGEAAGLKNADDYYPPFTEEQKQALIEMSMQPKPSPEIEKLKAEMEIKQKEAENKAEIEAAQAQADMAVKQHEAENDKELQAQKFAFDRQIKLIDLWMKYATEPVDEDLQYRQEMENETVEITKLAEHLRTLGLDIDDNMIPKKPPTRTETALENLMLKIAEMQAQNAAQIGQLTQIMAAPQVVDRDENGEIVGARRVFN